SNLWAFGAAVCQEHDKNLYPVWFVSKVFKDREARYTGAEQEVLALLKTLHSASHYLYGQHTTVYTRYSLMKWLFTSKSLTCQAVQWAAMLSLWTLTIIRSDKTPVGLAAISAASLVPRERLNEVLDDIMPMKAMPSTPVVRPLPDLRRDTEGHLLRFDGGVKNRETRFGSFGAVLWSLPTWTVVEARFGILPELTVNESEYNGISLAFKMTATRGIKDVIVCGNSRIVIGHVNGDLRRNQSSLQGWLNKANVQIGSFDNVHLVQVAHGFDQAADFLTRKAVFEQKDGEIQTTFTDELGEIVCQRRRRIIAAT
ncbi:TPA: hypothetical protein N0F65_001315, partial [Lagenidium giganteum]